jgi:hypothetical protein
MWNTFCFLNDFKQFIFNCRNNYLPLNNRLNAYRPEVDPRCTFCLLNENITAERDLFNHCFFTCRTVIRWIEHVLSRTGFNILRTDSEFVNLYWYGILNIESLDKNRNFCFVLFFDSFRYIVYRNRVRRIVPEVDEIISELEFFLQCIYRANRKIHEKILQVPELANFPPARG